MESLEVDAGGRTLWLGTHLGLQRSDDGGATWQPDGAPRVFWQRPLQFLRMLR